MTLDEIVPTSQPRREARAVAKTALLGDQHAGLAHRPPRRRRDASTPFTMSCHQVSPAHVAPGGGHQDRPAALRPRAQHAVDVLQQRRDARGRRGGEARARLALADRRDAGAVRGQLGQFAVAVGRRRDCGRPRSPTWPRRCRRGCRSRACCTPCDSRTRPPVGVMLSSSPTQKLPAAWTIVGYGQRSARKSFSRSSVCRPAPPGSLLRWKLWLTTVQC